MQNSGCLSTYFTEKKTEDQEGNEHALCQRVSKPQSLKLKTGLPESKSHTLLGQRPCLICLCIPTDPPNAWHIVGPYYMIFVGLLAPTLF